MLFTLEIKLCIHEAYLRIRKLNETVLYFKLPPDCFHLYFHFISSKVVLWKCIFLLICKRGREFNLRQPKKWY